MRLLRRFARAAALACAMLALGGCIKINPTDGTGTGDDGAEEPPEVEGSLGAFDVVAKLKETSCGEGALGMANEWGFVVGIGAEGGVATWDVGSGPIQGDADGADLSFDASFVIDMRKGGDGSLPACSIERRDLARATLDDASSPKTFGGTLSYTFTPTLGSNCADFFVGSTAQFLELPCTAVYAITAKKRTD